MAYPRKFNTPEEMQVKIDEYFEDCEGHPFLDDDGKPMLDKWGNPIILGAKPLTVTGLALALGFTNRNSLLNYQNRSKKFQEVVERAKLKIENYAEMRLYDKDGSNGAKFNLQNNFRNWDADKAKNDDGGKGPAITIINDIPRVAQPIEGEEQQVSSLDTQAIHDAIRALDGQKESEDGEK